MASSCLLSAWSAALRSKALQHFNELSLKAQAPSLRFVTVHKNRTVYEAGSPYVYLLFFGRCHSVSSCGKFVLCDYTEKDVAWLNADYAVTGQASDGFVVKASVDCTLVQVHLQEFRSMMNASTSFRLSILERLGKELQNLRNQTKHLALTTATSRVKHIMAEAKESGYVLKPTQVAVRAGCSRELASAVLNGKDFRRTKGNKT